MGRLTLQFLGSFRAEADGQELASPDARRIPALLALLLLSGNEADKRIVAARLWPDADDERGLDSLRHLAAKAAHWLGPEGGRLTTPRYRRIGFDAAGCTCDLLAFDDAFRRWEKTGRRDDAYSALALYGGPFLDGELLDWVVAERHERERWVAALQAALDAPPEALPSREPRFLTSFVGRDDEIGAILQRLQRAQTRLLTLWGIGGVGKTRLACRLAEALALPFTFLDLTSLSPGSGSERILTLAADGLGRTDPQAEAAEDWLKERLAAERHLLLFDNAEHLAEGAAEAVACLLAACPHLQVLATSRAPLDVPGEVLWSVAPLTEKESVALFFERADLSAPKAVLDEASVADLCLHLDGLPLAIELAAAQLRSLTLPQLAEGLNRRFTLLRGTAGPARHRALEATLQGSWERLSESEKCLLSRLSLFAGSFALEAVEAICEGDRATLHQLIAHSLVVPGERFQLLESVKEFVAGKLIEREDLAALKERFHGHYAATFTVWVDGLWKDRKTEAMTAFRLERDNLRLALQWACEKERPTSELIFSLLQFWDRRCEIPEALNAISVALKQFEKVTDLTAHEKEIWRGLIGWKANFYTKESRWDESREILEKLRDQCESDHNIHQLIPVLASLGHIYINLNRSKEALVNFQRMNHLCRQNNEYSGWISRSLEGLAAAFTKSGRESEAFSAYEEALDLARRERSVLVEAMIMEKVADLYRRRRDYDRAKQLLDEVQILAECLDDEMLKRLGAEAHARIRCEQETSPRLASEPPLT